MIFYVNILFLLQLVMDSETSLALEFVSLWVQSGDDTDGYAKTYEIPIDGKLSVEPATVTENITITFYAKEDVSVFNLTCALYFCEEPACKIIYNINC